MKRLKTFLQTHPLEKVFLLIAIPFIGFFAVAIPAFQGWDEATHFSRTYQISEGTLLPVHYGPYHAGGPIPVNISQMEDAAVSDIVLSAKTNLARKAHVGYYYTYLKQNHPSSQIVNKYFSGSAIYSPVSYAPQSVGVFLARTLRLPLLSYDYVGRIFGAMAFLGLVYWAIKLIPKGKWVIFAIAMLPTSLAAAATLSPDALVNGAALLLVALFVKGIFGSKPLAMKYLLAILGVILVLALTKQTYFVFAALPLFLPPKRVFGSIRRYLAWNTIFIVFALAATLGWYSQVSNVAKNSYLETRPTLNINSSEQITYILHNPIGYASTLGWEIVGHSNPQYTQLAGVLTWKGIVMPQVFILFTYLGLLLAFVVTYYEEKIHTPLSNLQKRLARYGPLIVGGAMVCLIYTTLYLSFNPVGTHDIQGVQGRYFIPVLGLLLPLIVLAKPSKNPAAVFNKEKISYILVLIFIIQSVVALLAVIATDYIPHMQFV
jgi:uncharacterized membrane protein